MKLISCYIMNFGGLSDYACTFDQGLTVLMEPNGFGKTTLAEFIRAMFYGFPRANKALEKNRRKKYLPWQGGTFGGSLTFEHEGLSYRIERTFGEKPAADTFTLYDLASNQKSGRFTQDIGTELFHLDADSFERSTYFPQQHTQLHSDITSFSTDSIQAKLSDLVEDTNDVNNYESAQGILQKKRSFLIPYRSTGGVVAKAQEKISRLDMALSDAALKADELSVQQENLVNVKASLLRKTKERDAVRENIRLASEAAMRSATVQRYGQLKRDLDVNRRKAAELNARYPDGLPDVREVQNISSAMDEAAALRARMEEPSAYAEAKQRLEADALFQDDPLFEEHLKQCEALCETYADTRTALENASLSPNDAARLKKLETFFSPGIPDREQITECKQARQHILQTKLQLASASSSAYAADTPSDKGGRPASPVLLTAPFLATLILGVLALASGGVLLAAQFFVPGLCLAGAGVLLFIAAVYLRLRDMLNRAVSESGHAAAHRQQRENEQKILQLKAEAAEKEQWLTKQFSPYYGDRIPDNAEDDLLLKRQEYFDLTQRSKAARDTYRRLTERLEELSQRILDFLGLYFDSVEPDSFRPMLAKLQRRYDGYRRDREFIAGQDAERSRSKEALRRYRDVIQAFSDRYHLPQDLSRSILQAVAEDIREYGRLKQACAASEKAAEDFYTENREILASPLPKESYSMEELRAAEMRLEEEIKTLSGAVARTEHQILLLQETVDRIPEWEDAQEREKASYEEGRRSAALLDLTMDFLQKAKENLSTSYLSSIQQSFEGYLHRLTGEAQEHIYIDPGLGVAVDRQGKAREIEYFSAGQADLLTLCMRLALADALFRDTEPFIILDDPFVNLDDTHAAAAAALLKDLAKDHQILYLVCHSSRNV